ncbi:hypothetical protein [Kitasatospora sp. DSM 101779]|uniref:hypothetical protein n=1 Tax=Kitasatospora sp. DSM 101779 TaxID=2853165 RepID=UPI0021DAC270|nr:hypothetical protein [Kitasatospora sp. DSM 101779]MCU7820324.1 hypothetical protein [Kitasatospora sp. DSM 101779]
MNEETRLAEELSALADQSTPPSGVDVHGAVRRGRGRLLRRRVAVLTAATTVVACSVALAAVLPGNGEAAGPAVQPTTSVSPSPSGVHTWNPIPPPSGSAATPSETRTPAPVTGTDPLISDGRFGWLPDSIKTISYTREANGEWANALGDPGKFPTPSFSLKVFPAGVTPALPTLSDGKPNLPGYKPGNHAIRVDAPPVNGREAYWITASDPNFAEGMNILRWKTAEGRWAELGSGSLSGADRQRIPLKVAAGVSTGHWQVPLPLRIGDMPKGYTVTSVTLRQSRDGRDFTLDMSLGASDDGFIGVTVKPDVPDPVQTGPDGTPRTPHAMTCRSEHGVKACLDELGHSQHVFDAAGGAQGLLDRITLFGTDPATWSTAMRD